MEMPVRIDLDDPRVVALAKARQQLAHEGLLHPSYDDLPPGEQEGCRWAALHYLNAAIRAGIIPPAGATADETWQHQEHCNPIITGACACTPDDSRAQGVYQ